MDIVGAIESRQSCRAFLDKPVSHETIREIVKLGTCAPSGGNLQPWSTYVFTGEPLSDLRAEIAEKAAANPRGDGMEYDIYPPQLAAPFTDRRFKCGEDLYSALNLTRDDKAGRIGQFMRNFDMFGAPVVLFAYIDKSMGPPQWSDVGMFLQTMMLAARQFGLHTCAQEALAQWHTTIARHTGAPQNLMFFCGLAIGYMDEAAPQNNYRCARASLEEVCTFKGF